MKTFLRFVALFLLSALFFHVLAVLFGAPIFSAFNETLAFAIVLSICATVPSIITVSSWSDFFRVHFDGEFLSNKERIASALAKSSILGAWIGAFPIPLDWDRWWQQWPITCVVGSVIGFICGLAYTRFSTFQRRTSKPQLPSADFKPKSV